MNERNRIKNMSDLRVETAKLRKSIQAKEKEFSGDVRQIVESITPMNIISGITSKLVTSAPAIYTGYSILKSIFGKKRTSEKD
jgi:hypothetical protein